MKSCLRIATIALLLMLICSQQPLAVASEFIASFKPKFLTMSIPELRKHGYRVEKIHGVENVVIDDMLFRINIVHPRSVFTGAKWPGGVAVFQFDSSALPYESTFFTDCAVWTALANVSCRLRTPTDKDYFTVYTGDVNEANVGMQQGQIILLNWGIPGIVEHELAHVLGFLHEQERPDRDAYVQINWPNIQPGESHNFDKYSGAETLGPYDYESIMEYGVCDFSTNPQCTYVPNDPNEPAEKKTIVPTACDSTFESEMGQRVAPSYYDGIGMQDIYGPAVPLAMFKSGRNRSCGIETLGPVAMKQYCSDSNKSCRAAILTTARSETHLRQESYCPGQFAARPACVRNKQLFNFTTSKGGWCGLGGLIHTTRVVHESWQCSCVITTIAAMCRNSANGLLEGIISKYRHSQSALKRAIGGFAISVETGVADRRVAPNVAGNIANLLMQGYPGKEYVRDLIRAQQLIHSREKSHSGKPITLYELERIVSRGPLPEPPHLRQAH